MNDTRIDGRGPAAGRAKTRLDSWKKIAAHFNRDVTTVQRWERREGMPVHRHVHDKQGSVYAFRSELDTWWESRCGKLPDSGDGLPESFLSAAADQSPPLSSQVTPEPETAAALRGSAARFVTSRDQWLRRRNSRSSTAGLRPAQARLPEAVQPWRNPLANATFTRLTDWPGIEQAAEISRDGRWVSFLADHDGHMDAWLTRIGSGSYRNLTQWRSQVELVNPSIRTLGFSADGSIVTVWTRSSDGSHAQKTSS